MPNDKPLLGTCHESAHDGPPHHRGPHVNSNCYNWKPQSEPAEGSVPPHNCNTDDRKLPINRPCSACSGGDPDMDHHLHCPPFRDTAPAIFIAAPVSAEPERNPNVRHRTSAGDNNRATDNSVHSPIDKAGSRVSTEPVITPEQFWEQWAQGISNHEYGLVSKATMFEFAAAYAQYYSEAMTAHALEEERAKLTKLLPESFYADRCLAFRMELLVDNWKRATKANQILEDELAKLRAELAALKGEEDEPK